MIPVDSFYQKLNSVRAVVVKRKAILIVVFLQINSSYLHLLQMDFSLLARQHFGCVGCLKIWPLSNSQQFSSSHLLRDSKHWNWRVNIYIKFFCKFTHKVFFDFSFFYIFSEKEIHPSRVCLSNDETSNTAEIIGQNAAKSKTFIWSKSEYSEFISKNTTE